jgi:hypothetical protein
MKRESGYYHIRIGNKWTIASYRMADNGFPITTMIDIFQRPINEWEPFPRIDFGGGHFRISEYEITEINETRIKNPDEK